MQLSVMRAASEVIVLWSCGGINWHSVWRGLFNILSNKNDDVRLAAQLCRSRWYGPKIRFFLTTYGALPNAYNNNNTDHKRLNRLVSWWPGPQDFSTCWRTARVTVFIPADLKVQFSFLSRDFSSWGRRWHVAIPACL